MFKGGYPQSPNTEIQELSSFDVVVNHPFLVRVISFVHPQISIYLIGSILYYTEKVDTQFERIFFYKSFFNMSIFLCEYDNWKAKFRRNQNVSITTHLHAIASIPFPRKI